MNMWHIHSLNENYFLVSKCLQLTIMQFLQLQTPDSRLSIWEIYVKHGQYSDLQSILLGCGTRLNKWGTQWDSNSLMKVSLSSLLTINPPKVPSMSKICFIITALVRHLFIKVFMCQYKSVHSILKWHFEVHLTWCCLSIYIWKKMIMFWSE